ncbi:ABC transporter ATP-binding protein [Henriciella mobilis]|uniref:ABC transporter ATP-binding protein n=1 Tax=Henriciella mobilis TaxID=2305467 RepID=UPI0018EF51DD|nr:ABC transporter ATP-binding protein [Henriciella mobilis]
MGYWNKKYEPPEFEDEQSGPVSGIAQSDDIDTPDDDVAAAENEMPHDAAGAVANGTSNGLANGAARDGAESTQGESVQPYRPVESGAVEPAQDERAVAQENTTSTAASPDEHQIQPEQPDPASQHDLNTEQADQASHAEPAPGIEAREQAVSASEDEAGAPAPDLTDLAEPTLAAPAAAPEESGAPDEDGPDQPKPMTAREYWGLPPRQSPVDEQGNLTEGAHSRPAAEDVGGQAEGLADAAVPAALPEAVKRVERVGADFFPAEHVDRKRKKLKGGLVEDRQTPTVVVDDVTIEFPVGPYAQRGSLKSAMFSLFGHREKTKIPGAIAALRSLSFRIDHGERVALVGHNGSGKSTLLRALAGVFPVPLGNIEVVGQIGTLLDFGTGFEGESTGRENILYRGMAMGISPAKIKEVEDEIIEFSALGDFIDMPMRTYSAGMFVRLGFAVSTQFSPDVLLIDEVFGAGDAAFQARAFTRMMDVVNSAGIMVLATHDFNLVEQLCSRVIWIEKGRIVADGKPSEIIPDVRAHLA